jgi:hypothetical protein
VEIRKALDALPPSIWKQRMTRLSEDLLLAATGTVVEALSTEPHVVTGAPLEVNVTALTRSSEPLGIGDLTSPQAPFTALSLNKTVTLPYTMQAPGTPDMPFWLRASHGNRYTIADPASIGKAAVPGDLAVDVRLRFADDLVIERRVPVLYRWVDRVKGELVKECVIVPPTSLFAAPQVVMVRDRNAVAHIGVDAFTDIADLGVVCESVADWDLAPREQHLGKAHKGDRLGAELQLRPLDARRPTEPYLRTSGQTSGPGNLTLRRIEYDHILPQTWYTPAILRAVPLDVEVNAQRVGYIMGAGDDVPLAIEQLGVHVETIDASVGHTAQSLAGYDAIVVGIRAYNNNAGLKTLNAELMRYVENGGTLVVQYTTRTNDMVLPDSLIGPYPFKLTRDRVTVEEAPATFLAPDHPLLNTPNKITATDFEGWVQERGLYFCGSLDPHYTPLIAWNDPGEQPLNGGLITCDHGKGRYVYTGISFFRQLPAGVPGAYRLFANLISKRPAP